MFSMHAVPVILDTLVPSWAAVLVAVTGVLFFGEIIPSAVFTGARERSIHLTNGSTAVFYPSSNGSLHRFGLSSLSLVLSCSLKFASTPSSCFNASRSSSSYLFLSLSLSRTQHRPRQVSARVALGLVRVVRAGALEAAGSPHCLGTGHRPARRKRHFDPQRRAGSGGSAPRNRPRRRPLGALWSARRSPHQGGEGAVFFLHSLISFFLPFGRTYSYLRCLYVYAHNFRSQLRRSSHLSQGALSLSTLTLSASQLVKPFGPSVFSLPLDARMDAALLDQIMAAGFSRVPIHLPGDDSVLLGYLLTKVKRACKRDAEAKRKHVRGNMR